MESQRLGCFPAYVPSLYSGHHPILSTLHCKLSKSLDLGGQLCPQAVMAGEVEG